MSTKALGAIGVLVIAAIIGGIALLGGDDDAQANHIDGAFLAGMAPHHEMAIEMAEMAEKRSERPAIRRLAGEIVSTQSDEIELIDSLHRRLFDQPLGAADHGTLGLPADRMGMDMEMEELHGAEPFDRMFIDMMIPHHQGAIRMARIELADGASDEAKSLAEEIITAQAAEIEQMNGWRAQWYGAPSPAGGVPAEDEPVPEPGAMDGMEH
jgi:uncharacterized protein (DUF305 family)